MPEGLGGGGREGDRAVLLHGDVLVEGEPALDYVRGTHGVQHRAQGVVDGEDMGGGAAGGKGQHGLAGERVLREQVQKGLEDAGVRRLVDGGADHDAVGAGEQFGGLDDGGVPEVRAEQGLGRDGPDVQRDHLVALGDEPLVQVAQQTAGARGGGGAAGDGQDGGHECLVSGMRRACVRIRRPGEVSGGFRTELREPPSPNRWTARFRARRSQREKNVGGEEAGRAGRTGNRRGNG